MRGFQFEGSVDADASKRGTMGARAGINIKLVGGGTRQFDISDAALKSLKVHDGRSNLIFFTNGNQVTAIAARGEKCNMRVSARTGDTFTLQGDDGQSRLITLDAKTASRLHVKVGSHLQITTETATSGKILALDLVKKRDFDKFNVAARSRNDVDKHKTDVDVDVDVAKSHVARAKVDIDVAKTKKAKKADIDVVKADIDAVKTDIDGAKTKKSKKMKSDLAKLDIDQAKLDTDVARNDCGRGSSRSGNPAFANQMAKDAANDASGHNPPGLPHECVNPAGHTRGFCKSGGSASICGSGGSMGGGSAEVAVTENGHKKIKSKKTDNDVASADVDTAGGRGKCGPGKSRSGNPAYANQMAKDAANDASGHNPPGLPHECVNPAGHTRGFCKSSSSEGLCSSGGASGGSDNEVASNLEKPCGHSSSSRSHNNPAFANQMAKDAANDASGHNPPGLPHECVNPAGHTRGFCKTRSSESSAMCGGSAGGGSGTTPSDLHGGIAGRGPAAAPGTGVAPGTGLAPGSGNGGTANSAVAARGLQPSESGMRGPGAPVGAIPVAGGTFGSGTRGATRGGAPTHVLGAASGPAAGRRVAALPTRVLPVAIQPVGKKRCVWYKTGVLGASTGPYRIIGTSANGGKPVLHKKCR
jgi:hypothetical protein